MLSTSRSFTRLRVAPLTSLTTYEHWILHILQHVSKVTSFWISFSSVDFGVWSTYEIACLGLSGLLQAFAHSQHHLAQLCNIVITTA